MCNYNDPKIQTAERRQVQNAHLIHVIISKNARQNILLKSTFVAVKSLTIHILNVLKQQFALPFEAHKAGVHLYLQGGVAACVIWIKES